MITGLNSRSRKHNSCFNLVFLYVGLNMLSDSVFNVLVISDLDCFSSLRDFWDRELKDLVNNPLLSSCLLTEYYKLSHVMGWQPFLFVFLSNKRIVGFAPLLMRSRFGFREVANIHQFVSVDFFADDSREFCVDRLIDLLFHRFNCASINLTFEKEAATQRVLEVICDRRGLSYSKMPADGEAMIPVNKSWESFQASLGWKRRKSLRRIARRVDGLGSWKIDCKNLDSASCKRIREVEAHSWKNKLTGKDKIIKELDLQHVLKAAQENSQVDPFEVEVWFLNIDSVPISYQLVLLHNGVAFFTKTSYDSRFKKASPGIFLINHIIEQIFKEQAVNEISFVSNLPFEHYWNPLVKERTSMKIEKSALVSKLRHLLFKNRFSRIYTSFLEKNYWKKLHL